MNIMPFISNFAENSTIETFEAMFEQLPVDIQEKLREIRSPKKIPCDVDILEYFHITEYDEK